MSLSLIELFVKDDKITVNRTSPELISFAEDSDFTILQIRHLPILDMKKSRRIIQMVSIREKIPED